MFRSRWLTVGAKLMADLFLVRETPVEVQPALKLDHRHDAHFAELDRPHVRQDVAPKVVLAQAERSRGLLDGQGEGGDVGGLPWRGHERMIPPRELDATL